MKKIILAVAAVALLAASPAAAQYFQGNRPPPPPAQQPYAPPPAKQQYDNRGYNGPRQAYDNRRGPRQRPRICFTGRGECPAPAYAAPGQSCRCVIPGFGPKRGNVR